MSKSPFCTLSDAELTEKAKELIQELIDSGGRSWVLNIPARPNSDPDLIFTELNERFKKSHETIKVLEYDNNKLKGEVEGLKSALDELQTKYDNILATESGHESKTENVWQSGYAAGHEAGYERGKREAQPGVRWVKADTKPEHNVGVIVFIPGEDNHITSGMWDISNKWVLLDEYRTPEEEVTHWMPYPAFPEGYTWNEIPDDLVDALKKVAKEELTTLNPELLQVMEDAEKSKEEDLKAVKEVIGGAAAGREDDRNEFAEWCRMQPNYGYVRGMGWMCSITHEYFTTDFMYELFKQQKIKA